VTKASGTIVSSTIVSSGEYRRSRDPNRNTYRRRMSIAESARPLTNAIALRMIIAEAHGPIRILRA